MVNDDQQMYSLHSYSFFLYFLIIFYQTVICLEKVFHLFTTCPLFVTSPLLWIFLYTSILSVLRIPYPLLHRMNQIVLIVIAFFAKKKECQRVHETPVYLHGVIFAKKTTIGIVCIESCLFPNVKRKDYATNAICTIVAHFATRSCC